MVDFIRSVFNPQKKPSYSIVALLDDEHAQTIRTLWEELEAQFGIAIPFDNPIPHITHLQAGTIKDDKIEEALNTFAQRQAPYIVRTSGLGIFTGERNALYISVVRNPNLTAIQTTLISALVGSVENLAETHMVNHWMPHISLAIGLSSREADTLGRIVSYLVQRTFAWEITVRQLAVLDGTSDADAPLFTVTLRE